MLRAFKAELRMADLGLMREIGQRTARLLLMAAAMFVLCRAQPVPGLAPMAMGFFAAILAGGARPQAQTSNVSGAARTAALLLGGMLGAISAEEPGIHLSIPIGMAIVLGGGLAWDWIDRWLSPARGPQISKRRQEAKGMVACAILSGMAVLVPGMVAAEGELWPSVQTMGAAAASAAAAPFLHAAVGVRPARRFLLPEERTGLMLFLCGLVAGLTGIWPPLAAFVAVTVVLLAYPAGAATGIAMGLAHLIMGGDARFCAMLCASGLAAQAMGSAARWTRAGVVSLTSLAVALFLAIPAPSVVGVCIAAAATILLPDRLTAPVRAWAQREPAACDPDRLAMQLRRQTVERLRALSAAFGELAEGYLTPCATPDEQTLIAGMRARLCAGCASYAECWAGGSNQAVHFLCALISEAVDWADSGDVRPLFGEEMPPDVLRRCRRGRLIPERLSDMLEDFACARRAELKRGAENRLISAQFLQAQQLLNGLADSQARPISLRDRQAARAASALEQAGIEVADVMALSSPQVEIIAALKDGRWTPEMAGVASAQFARAFGRVYLPEGEYGREMRFVRRPRFCAATGAGCVSREAGVPSGDSHLVRMLDDERLLILICDGMGSGEAAARESAAAVKLLSRFLAAGAACPLAIETVNALLLNRSGEDMFATVDMLILNLTTGMAEFVKLAACPSLIARSGEILRVEGGRLPLGILERVQPAISRVQLLPGDVVLMASDGVMDAADPDRLEAALLTPPETMADLAQRVLAIAGDGCEDFRRDDMTAICLRMDGRSPARRRS